MEDDQSEIQGPYLKQSKVFLFNTLSRIHAATYSMVPAYFGTNLGDSEKKPYWCQLFVCMHL